MDNNNPFRVIWAPIKAHNKKPDVGLQALEAALSLHITDETLERHYKIVKRAEELEADWRASGEPWVEGVTNQLIDELARSELWINGEIEDGD